MTLASGQQLLHYRLVEQIGAGGMGVVWRALDTSLDRNVAVKVLPADFATDAERLARFEREARLLASLNHPNIAAVYGLHQVTAGFDGDVRFIAMELVEGEDLATRVARGPLPVEDALSIARQVAAALTAAHDSGVVHRDLKPANIRLTPDGTVKVLDFGLAKGLDPTATSGSDSYDPSLSPTVTSAGTRAGMILGTAAYMSPQQARGKPVDRRADTWAFGCVLYEMLTGDQAFGGDTVTDVLAAILTRTPDLTPLAARVPGRLVRLLERCLEKDATRRLRDAGDIGLEIEALQAGDLTAEPGAAGVTAASPPLARTAVVAGAAMLLGAAAMYFAGTVWRSEPAGGPLRLTVTVGDGQRIQAARLTRDGQRLVLELEDAAYVRRLDSFDLLAITHSKNLAAWVESPDGRSIVYRNVDDRIFGGGKLRRAVLATGQSSVLYDETQTLHPMAWDEDGLVVFEQDGGFKRLRLDSGERETLFELERAHPHGASTVPGTDLLLAVVHRPGDDREWAVEAIDLAGGTAHRIIELARAAALTPNGYLVLLRGNDLLATKIDRKTLEVRGVPVPVVAGVRQFSLSETGTLAYLPTAREAERARLIRVHRSGEQEQVSEGAMWYVRYSPDGRWAAVLVDGGVDLLDLESGARRPLRHEGGSVSDHVWRSDGKAVVYTAFPEPTGDGTASSDTDRFPALYEQALDGSAPRRLLDSGAEDAEIFPTGYAPDGSGLAFARYENEDSDLWWLPADGSPARPLLATEESEDLARFSPDTRFVAYETDASDRQEIWVARYRADPTGLAEKWRVSREGGRDPIWSPDGTELYFEDLDDRLLRVEVRRDPTGQPTFTDPEPLFDLRAMGLEAGGDVSYDVSPSGDHWLFYGEQSHNATEVRVVVNWLPELERIVRDGG